MCGEHAFLDDESSQNMGSSPHVRGARGTHFVYTPLVGIIPACAGSTGPGCCHRCLHRDHPRMCGEHAGVSMVFVFSSGSSPHVRGAPVGRVHRLRAAGIIPACAGSTDSIHCRSRSSRDHPRMCGEHSSMPARKRAKSGSSPHVRGAHVSWNPVSWVFGIIPACAGSTVSVPNTTPQSWDHPRMCGEHVLNACPGTQLEGSSPHVRGALVVLLSEGTHFGIIPACAGSTPGHSG